MTRVACGIGIGFALGQGSIFGALVLAICLAGIEFCDIRLKALQTRDEEG